jgi:exosortase E/protease (VPEID-CTERM system)
MLASFAWLFHISRSFSSTNATSGLISRTALLLFLLAAELLAFSFIYDLQPLQQSESHVLHVVGNATSIFRVVAIAAITLVALGRQRTRVLTQRWIELSINNDCFGRLLTGHLIAAISFWQLSSYLLRPNGSHRLSSEIWLWLALAGLAFAFWLAAFAPIRFWRDIFRSQQPAILILSLLIGLAINYATFYSSWLWIPLSDLTMTACARLLGLLSHDVVYDPVTRLLGTKTFQITVAPVCSGYEGIGLVTSALALFLIVFRKNLWFPNAFLVLPVGIAAVWFCNVLRIVALIFVGTHISEDVAVKGFHSQAGWIGFAFVTLAVAYTALRAPLFAKIAPAAHTATRESTESKVAAYLMPMLAMIAGAMLVAALSSGFEALYPVKVLLGLATLGYFYPVYIRLNWSLSWLAAINGVVVFVLWILMEPATSSGAKLANGLAELSLFWQTFWIVFRVGGAVAIVPLAEELAFRGYLLRRVTSTDFETVNYGDTSWIAVAISSTAFGMLHGRWFAGTIAGVFYAIVARRRGRLCDAVLAHAVTNGLIAIYVLLTKSWQLWS